MKIFKLFLAVAIMASLLAIPCTTSFAENSLSAHPAAVQGQVVKKEDVKKERGFIERIFYDIGNVFDNAFKSVVNFFRSEEKPATTEQRKAVEPVQPPAETLAAAPETPAPIEIIGEQERAAEPAKPTTRQAPSVAAEPAVPQEAPRALEKADIPQVQPRVQIQPQVIQPQVQIRQPTTPPSTPAGATRATPPAPPVITITQGLAPQQANDLLGLSKIEVEPEVIPEVVGEREPEQQPKSPAVPVFIPPAPPKTPSDREPSDIREPAERIEPVEAPKTVAIIQTPVFTPRTPSDRRTTTTERRTTTPAGETTTTLPRTRDIVIVQPTEPATEPRITPPAPTPRITPPEVIPEARKEPAMEPEECPSSHTERIEGEITGMTANDRFAVVDTVDNRTFVVSLCGEGKIECPTAAQQTATAGREITTRTTAETDRTGVRETAPARVLGTGETLAAPASIPTGDTLTQRAATTAKTLAAGTLQQVQAMPDALRADMLAECPETQRPPAVIETLPGPRFTTTVGNRTIYVIDNSIRTFYMAGVAPTEEGGTPQTVVTGEEVTPPEGDAQQAAASPILDVLAEPGDCQATLKATVFCLGTTDCTNDFEINASFKVGKTEMNDYITRLGPFSFLLAPSKEPVEPVKGLSVSLNKADIEGSVTVAVTAKKGETLLEEIVDFPGKEDLIARCVQPEAAVEGGPLKAYDEAKADQVSTGSAHISGAGCSLIRR